MAYTTIQIRKAFQPDLKSAVERHGCKTAEQLIQRLLAFKDAYPNIPLPNAGAPADAASSGEEGENEKEEPQQQLLSYAYFEQHRDILAYLTGLNVKACEWLFPQLENYLDAKVTLLKLLLLDFWVLR